MQAEANEFLPKQPYRLPLYNLRWSAVLGGLIVGVSAELFLLLVGAAVGLAFVNRGHGASEESLLMAASLWNTLAMIVAALVGGYVAARASGMRRTADGILHGVIAWGVAMLALLLLATSTVGAVLGEILGGGATTPMGAQMSRPLDGDEREAIVDVLTNRLGLTDQQAVDIASQIQIPGHPPRMNGGDMGEARNALHAASMLSGWLSTAILLSLLGAIGGGMAGSRSMRRVVRNDLHPAAAPTPGIEGERHRE